MEKSGALLGGEQSGTSFARTSRRRATASTRRASSRRGRALGTAIRHPQVPGTCGEAHPIRRIGLRASGGPPGADVGVAPPALLRTFRGARASHGRGPMRACRHVAQDLGHRRRLGADGWRFPSSPRARLRGLRRRRQQCCVALRRSPDGTRRRFPAGASSARSRQRRRRASPLDLLFDEAIPASFNNAGGFLAYPAAGSYAAAADLMWRP